MIYRIHFMFLGKIFLQMFVVFDRYVLQYVSVQGQNIIWASLWENQSSGGSDQVPHKPGCTTKQDGERLEISYLGSRRIVLSV